MRKKRWLWLLVGAVGLALLVLVSSSLINPRPGGSTAATAATTLQMTADVMVVAPQDTDSPLPPVPTASPTTIASPTPVSITTPSSTPPPTETPTPSTATLPVFGAEMVKISAERGLALARPAGLYWLRYNGLRWASVETTRGARHWEEVADLESQLQAAFDAGLQTILIVHHTPEWAQAVPGSFCSASKPEALEDMAAFLADAVNRYKDPPFGIKYWELGNEPDVDPALVGPNSGFGCWGDEQDPYYGGEYYARMLQVVYPAIKAADPEAQVLLGGLLLDRDPTVDEHPNPPALFLEGVLRGGGGDSFDVVCFHSYVTYDGVLHDWETVLPTWQQRGGSLAGKVDFLEEVLATYGYDDKPLMLTEAGLLCRDCPSPAPTDFLEAQAAYLPRLYVRSMAMGLRATIWFTFDGPGWRQASLLDANQEPKPAYHALQALTSLLAETQYAGPINRFPGLEGYAFRRRDAQGEIWVLWSPDSTGASIDLPTGLQQAYDLLGAPLSPQGGVLEVGFAPVYLELAP
jgi:hypothetical protein